uniref:RNA-dependent RNA polymerase n=1 Tax=Tasmanian devil-associated picobirnavirus 1 TaxID=2529453 RepID=A0A481W6N4_9VIRU|nr:MAG: RNA-dependent RNA polymerase [Tasmanian devil-associated picobirnavirus 1]
MNTRLPKEFLDVVLENNGLKQYLSVLSRGRQATPRSWLYEQQEPEKVRDKWLSILESLDGGSPEEKNVYHFDTSQLEKWGPQGEVAPIADLMDIVNEGFSRADAPQPEAFTSKEWAAAKQTVRNHLSRLRLSLRPAAYKHVVDDMRARDTLESNSGWPLFTRRNKPEVISQSIADAESGRWKTYPAIALFRNYNLKTRLVWMFPMSANLVEGSFLQPLQSKLMTTEDPYWRAYLSPWKGFDEVRQSLTEAYESGRSLAASDFSSTDAHFLAHHTSEVCDVIEVAFQPSYREALRDVMLHMHQIPLVISKDEMITGEHGVSSGSNWTNFVETIFDIIFQEYVKLCGVELDPSPVIGDDMSWNMPQYSDAFAEELEQLGEKVGHVINASKTTNEPDRVKFLQRLFQRGYSRPDRELRGVYPTVRALKSLLYPERFHKPKDWSTDMFCARTYMILENCVDHPLFEEFVKFVVNGHSELIPFAKKSSGVIDRIHRESKLLPGLNPTYNQERRDSALSSFESIKYARTL